MCMITAQKEPFIAKEDLVCYKVLLVDDELFKDETLYLSPYYKMRWTLNEVNKTNRDLVSYKHSIYDLYPRVDIDAFHSYISPTEAKNDAMHLIASKSRIYRFPGVTMDDYMHELNGYYAVFKAIIPKGSKYFESYEGQQYASDTLIVTDEMVYDYPQTQEQQ